MRTFRELIQHDINEQSIAMKGDWQEGVSKISTMSETMILKWQKVDDIMIPKLGKTFELRQLRNSLEFILGYWDVERLNTKIGIEEKNVFETVFKIGLKRYKLVESKLGYVRLINVQGVIVLDEYTNNGISTIIYKYLVNNLKYTILGDEKQYFGARKLWARLSKDLDVRVDIIDISSKTKILENIILHHGNYDKDFDEALWSYENDKTHLRSVLVSIL